MILGTDEYRRDPASGAESYFNSALLVGDDGRSRESYQKMRLVPFGEYVPFRSLLFFVGPLVEKVSAFTAGTRATVLDTGRGRISTAICYESVVPSVSRAFVRGGSQLLATITNDAWFGRSSAAHQHWEQGAIRAVEQGRYIVRAANTGVSGAVDPYGRTILRTDLFEATSRVVDVRLHDGLTLYARAGDVIVWIGLLVTVGLVATGRRQRTAA
jgi:apolipoprotein N-acyltransferase